jgi:peptidoglycan/LPS O-acetylase OafA/YrhL
MAHLIDQLLKKPGTGPRAQIDSLDGLRGVAVLFVVFSHLSGYRMDLLPGWSWSGAGKVGVWLFFVLSSFLLTSQFLHRPPAELLSLGLWLHYAQRRFFRIFPLYCLALLVGFLFPATPYFLSLSTRQLFRHLTLQDGRSIFWSIPVEFKYYFLLPLVVLAIVVLLSRRLWPVLLTGAAAVAMCRVLAPAPSRVSLTPYLPIFLLGSLSAFVYWKLHAEAIAIGRRTRVALEFAAAATFLGVLAMTPRAWSLLLGTPVPTDYFHKDIALFGLLWSGFLLSYLHGIGWIEHALCWPPLRILGVISFSVYIWHMPVIRFVAHRVPIDGPAQALTVLALTTVFSTCSYLLIEKPFLKIMWLGQHTRPGGATSPGQHIGAALQKKAAGANPRPSPTR